MTREELRVWLAIFTQAYHQAAATPIIPASGTAALIFACLAASVQKLLNEKD